MTSAEILAELRNVWGLSVTDYPDAKLTPIIEKARKKLSEYYPFRETTYTATVANQTRYTVTHTEIISLREIYYTGSVAPADVFSDPNIKDNIILNDSTYSPSKSFEFLQRIKMFRELHPVEGVIISHDKFDLLPTPETSGIRVYYEYDRFRTLAEIPEMFFEDMIELIMFTLKDVQFKKSSRLQGGNVYNFDRRGNTKEKGQVSEEKEHKTIYDNIIRSIKDKVVKM